MPVEISPDILLDVRKELFKRNDFDFITVREGKKHKKQEQALCILTDRETEEFGYGGAASTASGGDNAAFARDPVTWKTVSDGIPPEKLKVRTSLPAPTRVSKYRYACKKYPKGQPHSGPCSSLLDSGRYDFVNYLRCGKSDPSQWRGQYHH